MAFLIVMDAINVLLKATVDQLTMKILLYTKILYLFFDVPVDDLTLFIYIFCIVYCKNTYLFLLHYNIGPIFSVY